MEGQCHLCGSSRNVDMCNCPKDPIPLCEKCCDKHDFAHGKQTTTKEVEAYCTFDEFPAIQICIACMSNLCEECCKGHAMQCGEIDLYPIELTELVAKGDEGIRRMKRGKIVDNTVAYLRQMLTTIRQKTQIEVESAFRSVEETLLLAKETVMTRLDEQIEKLGEEMGAFESRMNEVKYSESFTPSTNLEQLVFAESFPEIQSRLDSEHWFESVTDKALLSQISTDLVHVKKSTLLFSEVSAVCSWVGRYALLIGEEIRFCDLDTMEVFQANFNFDFARMISCIQLPTGEYFVCGEPNRNCFLIDNSYIGKTLIGHLPVPRFNPGLALFENFVYIFAGANIEDQSPTRTIQRFDLVERKGENLAPCEMVLERTLVCPCVHKKLIYLFGGRCPEPEIFDPVALSLRFIPISLQGSGPSVVFPFENNALMVLSCYQYVFDTEKETIKTFSYDEEIFLSPLSPIQYGKKWYFTVYDNKMKKYQLAYATEGEMRVRKTNVMYVGS